MKQIIDKKKFVLIMNRLKATEDLDSDIQSVINKHNEILKEDFIDSYAMRISHEDIVVELLSEIMEPDMDDSLISWWIYETDYGRDFKIGDVTVQELDGSESFPDLSDADKLYDYLTKDK